VLFRSISRRQSLGHGIGNERSEQIEQNFD